MDVGVTILLTLAIGVIFLIIQRTEKRRRLVVILVSLVVAELLRRYIWYRGYHTEALVALIVAFLANFSFWLFIGRYNPPGSSDDIQVIGLDD